MALTPAPISIRDGQLQLLQKLLLVLTDGNSLVNAHALLDTALTPVDPANKQLQAQILAALGTPAQSADVAAVVAAIKAQIEIADLFVVDATGATYVRRQTVAEGSGAINVTIENLDGTVPNPAPTAPFKPAPQSASVKVGEPAYYDVTAAAAGIAVGDIVARTVIYDTAAGTATAVWLNLTQGTTLATAPIPGINVREQTQNLSVVPFAPVAGAGGAGSTVALTVGTAVTTNPVALAIPAGASSYRVRAKPQSAGPIYFGLALAAQTKAAAPTPYDATGANGAAGNKSVDPGQVPEKIGLTAAQIAAGTLYLSGVCPSGAGTLEITFGNGG